MLQAPEKTTLQAYRASPLQARRLQHRWTATIDTPETDIRCLEEFGAYLYMGTSTNGRIYRTLDGKTSAGYANTGKTYVWALFEYGSYLLAGLGEDPGQIQRSSDGTTWTVSYSSANYHRIQDFAVFGSYCYGAGTGTPSNTVCKIVRSADGVTWAEVYSQAGYYAAHSLAVFGSKLYCSCGASGRILSSSDGTTWGTAVTLPGVAEVRELKVFGAYLYAGVGGASYGEVWRSSDGSSWSKVATLTQLNSRVFAMSSYNSQLFATGIAPSAVYRTTDGETWYVDWDGDEGYGICLQEFLTHLYLGTGTAGKLYRRD